jgi:NADH pyrophosphatase NudC (nudix superfamily)
VAYLAAAMIIAGVALFVAAPLAGGLLAPRRRTAGDLDRDRLEHDRGLAVQGLRELEFDREMGKLSDVDYQSLRAALEQRALAAMSSLDDLGKAEASRSKQAQVRRIDSARSASPRKINFCPQCGVRSQADAKFCAECGAPLKPRDRATGRGD